MCSHDKDILQLDGLESELLENGEISIRYDAFRNLFVNEPKIIGRIEEFISSLEYLDEIYSENYLDDLLEAFEINLSENGETLEFIKLIKLT